MRKSHKLLGDKMKLKNGTYVPYQDTELAVEVSPEAYDILINSRFTPQILVQTHLGEVEGASIGALDIKKKEFGDQNVTSFLLSGDLIVWALTEKVPKRAFVFLATEYSQIQPMLR